MKSVLIKSVEVQEIEPGMDRVGVYSSESIDRFNAPGNSSFIEKEVVGIEEYRSSISVPARTFIDETGISDIIGIARALKDGDSIRFLGIDYNNIELCHYSNSVLLTKITRIGMTKEVKDIMGLPLASMHELTNYSESLTRRNSELESRANKLTKENKQLTMSKVQYKKNHDRLCSLKMSFWQRLVFLFKGE